MMRALILLALCLCLCGCWTPQHVYTVEGGVTLSVAGEQGNLLSVDITDDGYFLPLWFDVPEPWPESIQRLKFGGIPERVESHKQPMWLPDFQVMVARRGEPWHQVRVNIVNPGVTQGADFWSIKGVAMISGWLDEHGEPNGNLWYFQFNEQRGRVVSEAPQLGVTYMIEAWSSDHPANPQPGRARLVITVPGTDVRKEWSEP